MATCWYSVIFSLLHLGFLFNYYVAKITGVNRGIIAHSQFLVRVSQVNFKLMTYWLDLGWNYRRRALELLVLQNNPRFEENIKLFFGDILQLDNTSEHIDLHKMMHADFEGWRNIAKKSVHRLRWRAKILLHGKHERFLEMLELARRNALMLKENIRLSFLAHFTIKYIHHNGGLIDYAK